MPVGAILCLPLCLRSIVLPVGYNCLRVRVPAGKRAYGYYVTGKPTAHQCLKYSHECPVIPDFVLGGFDFIVVVLPVFLFFVFLLGYPLVLSCLFFFFLSCLVLSCVDLSCLRLSTLSSLVNRHVLICLFRVCFVLSWFVFLWSHALPCYVFVLSYRCFVLSVIFVIWSLCLLVSLSYGLFVLVPNPNP